MSFRPKCTVISLRPLRGTMEVNGADAEIFVSDCKRDGVEEIDTEFIDDINKAWKVPGHRLIGNYTCNEHLDLMDEI